MMNSFLGSRAVVDILLDNDKSERLFTRPNKTLMRLLGPVAVSLLGYPLETDTRLRARDIFGLLSPVLQGSVIDIGCAFGGAYTFELARRLRPNPVLGVDLDPLSIDLANRLNDRLGFENARFAVGDIAAGISTDTIFDIALTVETLEHIKDDRGAIRNIGRLLKPGGWLLVSVPYAEHPVEYDSPQQAFETSRSLTANDFDRLFIGGVHWRSGYNAPRLRELLTAEGFDVRALAYTKRIKLLPTQPYLFPVTYPLSRAFGPMMGSVGKVSVLARMHAQPRG